MRPITMSRTLSLAVGALVCIGLVIGPGVAITVGSPHAQASPRHPGAGDRITVVLTSDREVNSGASWYDSHNTLRSQTRVPLTRHDPTSARYSASLVFTSRVRHQRIDAVFQSSGGFARCAVWVNAVKVREKTAHSGQHATAYCGPDARPST
jgi:hypothetical protein